MKQTKNPSFLQSRMFRTLFVTYVLIIVVFVSIYAVSYVSMCQDNLRSAVRQSSEQEAYTWALYADQQLLSAQSMCNALNASENCRAILQSNYVQHKVIDSMQLYRVLNDIRHIKSSGNNVNVYSLMLGFQNDEKLYSPNTVIALQGKVKAFSVRPYIGMTSVSSLLGVKSTNILVNKEYLVYAENYTALNYSANARGIILVLFDAGALRSLALNLLQTSVGACIHKDGKLVFSSGKQEGIPFSVDSVACNGVTYTTFVPEAILNPALQLSDMMPILLICLTGLAFVIATYMLAKRYYRPINSIHLLMSGDEKETTASKTNDMDDMLNGIRNLVGERNGYREKILTIAPYARQGMLRSLISGTGDSKPLIANDQFMELKREFLVLAELNMCYVGTDEKPVPDMIYRDNQQLIIHICRSLSSDDRAVMCFAKDEQTMFVILSYDVSGTQDQFFQSLFDKVSEEIDDDHLTITIGVSTVKNELDQLKRAAKEAGEALSEMLTGGRGSVYYYEQDQTRSETFAFPMDMEKRMTQAFCNHDMQSVQVLLDELYAQNIHQSSLSSKAILQMLDELHYTMQSAARSAFDQSTTHLQIQRLPQPVTIDEAFSYYRSVAETVMNQYSRMASQESNENLDDEVTQWIEENLFDPQLSLNMVCARFGLSGKMIGSICRRKYGTTFLQYVRNRQIQKAAQLLQETDHSLEEIAHECGFTNVLTFRRNFKAVMNINPSDFRQ